MTDNKYQRGKIYAIRGNMHSDMVYIGSTTQPYLSSRLSQHLALYKQWKNGNGNWASSYLIVGLDGGCFIELVELFPCNSVFELKKREGEIIRATKNCINKNVAGRSYAQLIIEERERYLRNKRESYYRNSDKEKERMRQRYKDKQEAEKQRQREYYQKK